MEFIEEGTQLLAELLLILAPDLILMVGNPARPLLGGQQDAAPRRPMLEARLPT